MIEKVDSNTTKNTNKVIRKSNANFQKILINNLSKLDNESNRPNNKNSAKITKENANNDYSNSVLKTETTTTIIKQKEEEFSNLLEYPNSFNVKISNKNFGFIEAYSALTTEGIVR